MTRFSITMSDAVDLVYYAIDNGWGGDIILPVSASYKIMDVAEAIAPEAEKRIVGIRPGEKLHETMYTELDSGNTVHRDHYYIICPPDGAGLWNTGDYCKKTGANRVPENSACTSNTNSAWLDVPAIKNLVETFLNQ